nr:hypothetical protein [Tanacetum cinerariifolium]
GFSGNVTPLFETMMVIAQEKWVKKKMNPKRKQRQAAKVHSPSSETPVEEGVPTPSNDPLPSSEDRNEVFVDVSEKTVEKEVSIVDPVTTVGEVVTVASIKDSVAPTTATTADVDDELTRAKTLIAIKVTKPKVILTAITTPRAKGIVFHEQVQAHKSNVSSSMDKGKAKMIEPEKPLKNKDQISLDEEVVRKLEAEMRAEIEEEERIAREKDKANRALSFEERSKLLVELIESRRKYFAAKRAEEIRNKPPTKAQQRKNVEESLKKTKAEGSSKRAGQELEQENAKKQKLAEQKQDKVANDDTTELKRCLEIVPEDDDDVAIEATPLSSNLLP